MIRRQGFQSVMVATQPYLASPGLRASTFCVNLDAFPSESPDRVMVSFLSHQTRRTE